MVATPGPAAIVGAGGGYGMWNQDNQRFDRPPVSLGAVVNRGRPRLVWDAQVGCDYQFSAELGHRRVR